MKLDMLEWNKVYTKPLKNNKYTYHLYRTWYQHVIKITMIKNFPVLIVYPVVKG